MSEAPATRPESGSQQSQPWSKGRARPSYTDAGKLDIESVDKLARLDLQAWVHSSLRGHDPGRGTGTDSRPHDLIANVFYKLDSRTCWQLQNIVIDFLQDLARNPGSDWRDESGDELLMLVNPVLLKAPRKHVVRRLLLDMAEPPIWPDCSERQFGVLSALVTLKYRGSAAFWQNQFSRYGSDAASVVLEGLALIELPTAFDWVASVDWDEKIEDALISMLPAFIERNGVHAVKDGIEAILPRLADSAREAVHEFGEDAGLRFHDARRPCDVDDWIYVLESALRKEISLEECGGSIVEFVSELEATNTPKLSQRDALDKAISHLCARWNPHRHNHLYTCGLLELLGRFHSFDAFSFLLEFLRCEFLTSNAVEADRLRPTALRSLDRMHRISAMVRNQDRRGWQNYVTVLERISTDRTLAVSVIELAVQHLSDGEIASVVCLSLNEDACTVEDVSRLLKKYVSGRWEDVCSMIRERAWKNRKTLAGACKLILEYDKQLLCDQQEELRLWVQDREAL